MDTDDSAPHDLDAAGLPLPTDLENCHTVRRIGSGASGVVELVETRDGNQYAVKRLAGNWGDPTAAARFRREMRIVARLVHPNIVRSAGISSTDSASIVMEYLEGPSLHGLLQERPLGTGDALAVIGAVCAALQHAHDLGIVHRDVSPANILFHADGRPALCDFGISTAMGSDHTLSLVTFRTRPGTLLGTPTYMSPEAASGSTDTTPAWDIYSAGVLAYRLLVGRPPFENATSPLAVLEAHRSIPAPDPADFGSSLPPEVTAVVLGALAKDPDRRPGSIGSFWEKLSQAASEVWPEWAPTAVVTAATDSGAVGLTPPVPTRRDEGTLVGTVTELPTMARVGPASITLSRGPRRWPGRLIACVAAVAVATLVLVVLLG